MMEPPLNPGQDGWPTSPAPPPPSAKPTWERWREVGLLRGWFSTFGEVCFHPERTFGDIRRDGGVGASVGFFAITIWISNLVSFGFSVVTVLFSRLNPRDPVDDMMRIYAQFGIAYPPEMEELMRQITALSVSIPFQALLFFVIYPIVWLLILFVSSSLVHVLLTLFGGARYAFDVTLRANAYAIGCVYVLRMLPFCGCQWILVYLAIVALCSVALARAHQTDAWRAVLAAILTFLIQFFGCCCCGYGTVTLGLMSHPAFQGMIPPPVSPY
jgi:hypothetical protein